MWLTATPLFSQAEHSVARHWSEALLHAIRNDFARPTVHARNLFHTAVLMYDAWAVYDDQAQPYFLGRQHGGYICPFAGIAPAADRREAQETAISYAAYRLLTHRFRRSPGRAETQPRLDSLMQALGHDPGFTRIDYRDGSPAALGNYLAHHMIQFGRQDGSNEAADYANRYYQPYNEPLPPAQPGAPGLYDPNRWQPLAFRTFIDQSGNPSQAGTPEFLSPEWGNVIPFCLTEEDRVFYQRDGHEYAVYLDPGPPPLLGTDQTFEYQWGFGLVAWWSAHLDPADSVRWDISPAGMGNLPEIPQTAAAAMAYYNALDGGDPSQGHPLNPATGQPYEPHYALRGDYTRVLAEFWADGPDSETPPGHWFSILNYVHDHPAFERRLRGEGPVLNPLAWDVQAYLALGGAMHDAAIAAWSVKGYYDYVRPISALRYLAEKGQCSDPEQPNYDPEGMLLIPGFVELVQADDPDFGPEAVGKVKIYGWRGPDYTSDPETDMAGVGWILAENWWPYQRPTFVTPPFAGYVSGHSTFSRAAAEVLTGLTGSPYFPGGMGEFVAEKDKFLVFEEGPSEDIILQWATYRDASDQTSLSRIWGGIHPPADDIPGRRMGAEVGPRALALAERYFMGEVTADPQRYAARVYPNPVLRGGHITVVVEGASPQAQARLLDMQGRTVREAEAWSDAGGTTVQFSTAGLIPGIYLMQVAGEDWRLGRKVIVRE